MNTPCPGCAKPYPECNCPLNPEPPGAKIFDLEHYRVKKQMDKMAEFDPFIDQTWTFFYFPEENPFEDEDEE